MKTKITLTILTALVFSTFLCSCSLGQMNAIKGNGNIVHKTIDISDYDAVELSGRSNVTYAQSEGAAALTVDIDENLLEHLIIKVENRTLIIKSANKINLNFTKFEVTTSSKNLKKIDIAGSGNVTTNGKINVEKLDIAISGSGNVNIAELETKNVKANIAGSGDVTLKGIATNTLYKIAGSGDINTKELVQDTVKCSIAGSGNVTVNAEKSLKVSIAGSGDVYYLGNPSVDKSIAGSGKMHKID